MRIGNTRADQLGFIAFIVLGALLALLLIVNSGSDDSSDDAQQISTFASLPETVEEPQAVETTPPLDIPEVEEAPAFPTPAPTATPAPTIEPVDETPADTEPVEATEPATQASEPAPATDASAAAPAASTSGSGDGDVPNPQPAATAVPNPQPAATEVPNPQPASSGPITIPAAAPTGGTFTHTLTATVGQPTLYREPGGQTFIPTFSGTPLPPTNPTYFGNTLTYRVLAGEPGDDWAKVYVPARPNGQTAWVQTSQFNWGSSNRKIVIDVANAAVTVYEGSTVLVSTAAVVGKSSSPTPRAQGFVEEFVPGPSSAYGPWVISLGIWSEALSSFGGALPKIALHGTNNPGIVGTAASNGCIRVPNEMITQIRSLVQPGSRVEII